MQPGQSLTDYNHIDPSRLLEAVGGEVDTVASLARTFIDSAPAIFARLVKAVQEGDAERSRHESHSLKGMSAMFQAQALTMLLQQTEQAARSGQTPGPKELVQLQASFALVLDEIGRCARSFPQS